jgi:hypothetical protein
LTAGRETRTKWASVTELRAKRTKLETSTERKRDKDR